jgi:hypothetical protein
MPFLFEDLLGLGLAALLAPLLFHAPGLGLVRLSERFVGAPDAP